MTSEKLETKTDFAHEELFEGLDFEASKLVSCRICLGRMSVRWACAKEEAPFWTSPDAEEVVEDGLELARTALEGDSVSAEQLDWVHGFLVGLHSAIRVALG